MAEPEEEKQDKWKAVGSRAKAFWKNGIGGGGLKDLAELLEFKGSIESLTQLLNGRARDKFYRELALAFAGNLAPRYPDLESGALRDAIYRHLMEGLPQKGSEIFQELKRETASRAEAQKADAGIRRGADGHRPAPISGTKLPQSKGKEGIDLWTPGPGARDIIEAFGKQLDADSGARIVELSRDGIDAIARGDFKQQVRVADLTKEIGLEVQSPRLVGEAEYLRGEGLRLLADFERDHAKVRDLREGALAAYDNSAVNLGSDPRPIRGTARVQEVLGRPEEALKGFEQALTLTAFHLSTAAQTDTLSLAHELIRSIRHRFYCAAELRKQSPFGSWPSALPEQDFESLIVRSEREHKQVLARFSASTNWWSIEWFMAQVIHARGWLAIGQQATAAKRLLWALEMRLSLMPREGQPSDVEAGNLMWWLRVASEAEKGFDREQRPALEMLGNAIASGPPRSQLHILGDALLKSDAAPWARS